MYINPPQVEFELSAQDQAALPPVSRYESIIAVTEPYVPAIMRKVPEISTNAHQNTMLFHFQVRAVPSFVQLSYSHMHAIGWKAMNVPRRAPTSETRSSKTGMPLAMT